MTNINQAARESWETGMTCEADWSHHATSSRADNRAWSTSHREAVPYLGGRKLASGPKVLTEGGLWREQFRKQLVRDVPS